ncbi:hypothetical protein [Streptomyces sp. NPDC007369]|uniref:hypothetical protein n=1 Tax=Streptomyces sp. NPDC007369 TaxID=3154589 RepID=UPI0033CC6826
MELSAVIVIVFAVLIGALAGATLVRRNRPEPTATVYRPAPGARQGSARPVHRHQP